MSDRQPREFAVIGFSSTHDALQAEDTLKNAGIAVAAIPAPLALGSLCGIALRMEPGDSQSAMGLLAKAGLAVTGSATIRDV